LSGPLVGWGRLRAVVDTEYSDPIFQTLVGSLVSLVVTCDVDVHCPQMLNCVVYNVIIDLTFAGHYLFLIEEKRIHDLKPDTPL